jgi:peptide chain release factor 1
MGQKEINENAIIIEIRAGAGGEEAGLFVKDLFQSYSKYATNKNWEQQIIDLNHNISGGYKKIIFQLKGPKAWPIFKHEGGVHRVQRIPQTEKEGRVHTSTVTIVTLPKYKQLSQVKIDPSDIKTDFFKSSGPGGQNVNKRQTAVRITHLPTGIAVSSQAGRTQRGNRENALTLLKIKLIQKDEEEKGLKKGERRKKQASHAERATKIRTYNFPRNQLTDHRINKSWHNLEDIMRGKLDSVIKKTNKFLN